jgi:hypothetical protein
MTLGGTTDNFGTQIDPNSTINDKLSTPGPKFNKNELVNELKAAMRTEVDFKFKKTEKDFIDMKLKLTKLHV